MLFSQYAAANRQAAATARSEAELAIESNVDQTIKEVDLPDGADDDQTVDGTKTDKELVDGKFGKDAEVSKNKGDVKVDADHAEVTHSNELEQEEFIDDNDDDLDDEDLDGFDADEIEVEKMELQMMQMADSAIAIEQFGWGPATAAVMQTTNLLAGTALESIALESVNPSEPYEAETQMALESIVGSIKNTGAKYSAKILSAIKSAGTTLLGAVEKVWSLVSGAVTALGNAAWDGAAATSRLVKAHPYKTIAAIIAAAAAVVAVVMYVGTGVPAPGGSTDAVKSFMTATVAKIKAIKLPFGSISAAVSDTGTKIAVKVSGFAGTVKAASVSSLGWTKQAAGAVGASAGRVFSNLKTQVGAVAERGTKLATAGAATAGAGLKAAGAKVAGTAKGAADAVKGAKIIGKAGAAASYVKSSFTSYLGSIMSAVGTVWKLGRDIVIKGFRMILASLRSVLSAVGSKAAAAGSAVKDVAGKAADAAKSAVAGKAAAAAA